ncbi:MAG: GxxExxY protein [Planctomycetes bacterium]|nr:GxxExxY protein [Planctomycetota bacterium]
MDPGLQQRLSWLFETLLNVAMEVQHLLGTGMPAAAYSRCVAHELEQLKLVVQQDLPVPIIYKGLTIEDGLRLDMVVDGRVTVRVICEEKVTPLDDARMHAQLRVTGLPMGVLLNFGPASVRGSSRRVMNPAPRTA